MPVLLNSPSTIPRPEPWRSPLGGNYTHPDNPTQVLLALGRRANFPESIAIGECLKQPLWPSSRGGAEGAPSPGLVGTEGVIPVLKRCAMADCASERSSPKESYGAPLKVGKS